MDIYSVLVIVHIIGTVLGVGGVTLAEIFYLKAIRDGVVDPIESDFLRTIYTVMRVGLILAVFSGFGFLILYRVSGATALLYSPVLWAKLTIIGILVANALAIHARTIPMHIGAAISFVSWYAALVLGVLRGLDQPYIVIMLIYAAIVVLAVPTLAKLQQMYLHKYGIKQSP